MRLTSALFALVLLAACSGSGTKADNPITLIRETVVAAPTTTLAFDYTFTTTTPTATTIAPTTTTTTTTVPNATVASAPDWAEEEIVEIVCHPRYEWDCEEALAVAWCESWHRPGAVSGKNTDGSRDWGLFQINDSAWGPTAFPQSCPNVLVPTTNTWMAHKIWQLSGNSWELWTCQP